MKRSNKTLCAPRILLVMFTLALLASGCAAPQASNSLEQRIVNLIQIQQQQALQLEQLQQQLASLSTKAPEPPQIMEEPDILVAPETVTIKPEPVLLPKPESTVETVTISQAAELYLEAFAAIATGQMAEAEAGFRTFIQTFPDHEYKGNANYWMAEALLAQQKTKRAESILLDIVDSPNQQNKAPASMARLVNLYRETGALNNASAMLQMLTNNYPESPELKRLLRSTEPR